MLPDEPKSINPFSYFPLSVEMVAFVNELFPICDTAEIPEKYSLGYGIVTPLEPPLPVAVRSVSEISYDLQ